ncbi:glycosyl hydrolase [Actinomadura scrupuli]|uniref:glycosyl hydrolase n=1 Tax=Actinomadura scrupuli TaxID=559629 RepID=UPI003D998276
MTATAVGAGAAISWGSPLGGAPDAWAEGGADAGRFLDPGRDTQPGFRWWWPDGMVDPAEIRAEIDQIADAGFGRVEIAAVHHSVTGSSSLDPAGHGWGTPAWAAGVEAALERAAERDVTVDLTIGPAWPASVPTITPDSPAAIKELACGTAAVASGATYNGAVPVPPTPAASGVTAQTLLAVQAFRVDPANAARKITGLEAGSIQDLTAQVKDGQLTWTAPGDGDYVLFGHWVRGSGQQPEGGPHTSPDAYVVDHFSRAGTQAVIDFWEDSILTPRIRKLLRKSGGALFEDSIELETKGINWTPGLPAEFEKRIGYSLMPYLPAVVKQGGNLVYAFEANLTKQIRRDLSKTLTQLINENHFTRLKTWAHSIGLDLRAQPYGLETDAISSAAILDIPEGESIGFKNLDDFRCLAGARDMAGRRLLSEELGAYTGGAYNTTWEKVLKTVGGQFAAGVNNVMVHGFSYASAPGANWPGFAAFTPYKGAIGYGESWGPRHPTWRHIQDVTGYLSRVQKVLREGEPSVDVAYFWQTGFVGTGLGAQWFTATGVPLGWTHQILSPELLKLPSAKVSGGRLASDGPAYKVLVVDGDVVAGREHTMPVETAERLVEFASKGLPIVFVGSWSDAHVPGVPKPGENDKLQALLTRLLAQPTVRTVADTAGIPDALAGLGIERDAVYAQSSTLLNAHRIDGDVDYYYFCNGKHAEAVKPPVAAIEHQVSLTRAHPKAIPFVLDAWSGKVERIATYTEDGDRITVQVRLQPGEATVIVLARPAFLDQKPARNPHSTSTEADQARFAGDTLVVRSARAGSYATVLSSGRTVTTTIADVPAVMPLQAWKLEVEDWQPGSTAAGTTRVTHRLTLDALVAWPAIAELQDVSGIGRYTATVELAKGWTGGYGAYLDLGEVFDTVRVTVNGRRLPPVDLLNPVVDVGPCLKSGTNTIEVEVATTLNNRLRVADAAVYGPASRQAYGLIGPVRLVPYGQAAVR